MLVNISMFRFIITFLMATGLRCISILLLASFFVIVFVIVFSIVLSSCVVVAFV